jgi:hypothetical protein
MDENAQEKNDGLKLSDEDLRRIIEGTVAAVGARAQGHEEKATLEKQLAELRVAAEGYRAKADAAERDSVVREELRRLGVTNVELGFRAVREDVVRRDDGSVVGRTAGGEVGLVEYLAKFVEANPELLPARRLGGSGSVGAGRGEEGSVMDVDSIRPGMDPAEMERARREVARVISRSLQR